MLVVGLTGGIASGKSTVSSLLQAKELPLIDLDVLARVAVSPGSYALATLSSAQHFGPSILLPDGSLDRPKLGSVIFNDERRRKELNGIVHPAVRRLLAWELIKAWFRGEKVVLVDAPLLIEAGLWKFCGAIVVVYCSEALQLQRLRSRNSLSLQEAQARISAQLPLSLKLPYADFIIENSGPLPELSSQIDRVVAKLHRKAGWSWILSWFIPPWAILSALLTVTWRLYIKRVGKAKREGRTAPRGERREEEIEMRDRRKLRDVRSAER